jgi:hypothetical protein
MFQPWVITAGHLLEYLGYKLLALVALEQSQVQWTHGLHYFHYHPQTGCEIPETKQNSTAALPLLIHYFPWLMKIHARRMIELLPLDAGVGKDYVRRVFFSKNIVKHPLKKCYIMGASQNWHSRI